ncbi:GNAT family N-acetyltransferase [Bacillus sp. B1-b2]|uniref:GNAT family N-acetyltransferase n=1 Tax=Bacillus sp. B1-b2 TaxID=2653201 RepID=UPI00126231C9|nr:GNAT family N-acetyltransferase [Bacillus sp. B1-b2]KAB7667770.1 GNAT family N-acetyltransferase [Bacillus sp. B1-b2]
MIIRDVKKEELSFIRNQRKSAYEEHEDAVSKEHWEALQKSILSDADIQPHVELLVAELDGIIVGSIALFPAKVDAYEGKVEELEYPEIRLLAVPKSSRGHGVATALLNECFLRAKTKGYGYIGLHTGSFMLGAIRLYESLGFNRLPQYDFEPANDGIIVRAYRRAL